MQLLSFVGAALVALPQLAEASFHSNLAYRSPSLTVPHLAHDVSAIQRRHIFERDAPVVPDVSATAEEASPEVASSFKGAITFPYGIASGDPLADSAILWTHPVPADASRKPHVCLRYQTSRRAGSWKKPDLADQGIACTSSDVDYSLKVETRRLSPNTVYFYRFQTLGPNPVTTDVGRFRTMVKEDDAKADRLNLAIFSCSNLPVGYFNSYRLASAKNDIDYVLHVGDYIYEGKPTAGAPEERQFEPRREISTLEDYRLRYGAYRGKDADLRAMHANFAWLPVWDDHEVADNAYKSGTADSNDTASGAVNGVLFSERKRNAVQAYYEWMPIRQVDTSDKLRIWRQFKYGKLADINMLDTRQYDRDVTDVYYNTGYIDSISNDESRSIMGGKQEAWLYKNLAESRATWKLIGQQVVVNHVIQLQKLKPGQTLDENVDAWDGYKANRRRLLDAIAKTDNVIILAGDTHAAWAFDTIRPESPDSYNASTGEGALGVEFAGTAVSSSSSYGKNLTAAQYTDRAQKLVQANKNLAFAEGQRRGYILLKITPSRAVAEYWGIDDNASPTSPEHLLATFEVLKGANRLSRPINGGRNSTAGAIQAVEVDQSSWNGTSFTKKNI